MAGSFQGVLAGIPGLGGYLAGEQNDQSVQLGQLQQAGLLQGILSQAAAQQSKKIAMEKEMAFRGALANAKTPEEQALVAARFGDPKDIMAHFDRQTTAGNTKELAKARLLETGRMNDSLINHRIETEKDAAKRTELMAERDKMRNFFNQKSLELGGEKLFYETGTRMDTSPPVPMAPTGPGAPVLAPAAAPRGALAPLPAGVPETDRAAFQAALGGGVGIADRQATPAEASRMTDLGFGELPLPTPAAPNNLDARDLGAGARGPVMGSTPAPVAAPAVPATTAMPPEIARLPKKYQDKWTADQAKASIAGAGKLTPEALQTTAEQYLAGDRQAIAGWARDAATKGAIQNEIVKQAKAKGWSGADIAAQMADFAGIMAGSRTVGTRAAQIELASSEALKMMDIVTRESGKFDRTNFVPWNKVLKAYEENTGTPQVRQLGAAINSLVNVYARAINPSGVATVSDKDHAREILRSVDSPDQIDGVIGIMKEEMNAARSAPTDVRKATREAVRSLGGSKPSGGSKPTADQFFR